MQELIVNNKRRLSSIVLECTQISPCYSHTPDQILPLLYFNLLWLLLSAPVSVFVNNLHWTLANWASVWLTKRVQFT